MRDQLIQYVNLLFAGAPDCEDMKQEILQNTLDRYDDLIAEGKVPEAAYRLAISGIGDINEILGTKPLSPSASPRPAQAETEPDSGRRKLLRAIAVALYILCPIPLIVLSEIGLEVIGLCGLLTIVAVATSLMIFTAKKGDEEESRKQNTRTYSPETELRRSIRALITAIGLAVYFVLSFATQMWFITWLVFPIIGAVQGLVNAILDLKEVHDHEN